MIPITKHKHTNAVVVPTSISTHTEGTVVEGGGVGRSLLKHISVCLSHDSKQHHPIYHINTEWVLFFLDVELNTARKSPPIFPEQSSLPLQ